MRLSATAAIKRALTTLILARLAASRPAIRAMLVTIAGVPPKLILLGLSIARTVA